METNCVEPPRLTAPHRTGFIRVATAATGLLFLAACSGGEPGTRPAAGDTQVVTTVATSADTASQDITPEDTATEEITPEDTAPEDTAPNDQVPEPTLVTPCFTAGPELALPDRWIAADVSTGNGSCLFVLQEEDLADTTVIAGELFLSSAGRSFEEFVAQVEDGLTIGQEPDILALQLLNSGASGRNLPILERIELDGPNRAVILIHESDRRDGFTALSAVVDVPTESDPSLGHAIQIWGLLLPISVGEPADSINYPLIVDLINSMRIEPQ